MVELFERLLLEADKSRFIKKAFEAADDYTYKRMGTESEAYKQTVNFANSGAADKYKIDWQEKPVQLYIDLSKALEDYTKNGGSNLKRKEAAKKDPNKIFLDSGLNVAVEGNDCSGADLCILKSLENDKFIFVAPLTYKGAQYCDSFECGGEGAQWCIGYTQDNGYWEEHVKERGQLFIMAFNKQYYRNRKENSQMSDKLKYMITLDREDIDETEAWLQTDRPEETLKIGRFKNFFGHDANGFVEAFALNIFCDDTDYSLMLDNWYDLDTGEVKFTYSKDLMECNIITLSELGKSKISPYYDWIELDLEGEELKPEHIGDTGNTVSAYKLLEVLQAAMGKPINRVTIKNGSVHNFDWCPEEFNFPKLTAVGFERVVIINLYYEAWDQSHNPELGVADEQVRCLKWGCSSEEWSLSGIDAESLNLEKQPCQEEFEEPSEEYQQEYNESKLKLFKSLLN